MEENQWMRINNIFWNILETQKCSIIYIYLYLYISISIYIYLYIYIYICIYLSISLSIYIYIPTYLSIHIYGHKWFTTHRVLKSHRSKMSIIYMLSWKQCALPVITTMALWQLMHLGTWCTVIHCWYQWTKEYSRVYRTHFASMRFEHSVCRGSLMATYIMLLA